MLGKGSGPTSVTSTKRHQRTTAVARANRPLAAFTMPPSRPQPDEAKGGLRLTSHNGSSGGAAILQPTTFSAVGENRPVASTTGSALSMGTAAPRLRILSGARNEPKMPSAQMEHHHPHQLSSSTPSAAPATTSRPTKLWNSESIASEPIRGDAEQVVVSASLPVDHRRAVVGDGAPLPPHPHEPLHHRSATDVHVHAAVNRSAPPNFTNSPAKPSRDDSPGLLPGPGGAARTAPTHSAGTSNGTAGGTTLTSPLRAMGAMRDPPIMLPGVSNPLQFDDPHDEQPVRFMSHFSEQRRKHDALWGEDDQEPVFPPTREEEVRGLGLSGLVRGDGDLKESSGNDVSGDGSSVSSVALAQVASNVHSLHRDSHWSAFQTSEIQTIVASPSGRTIVEPDSTVEALGAASWAAAPSDADEAAAVDTHEPYAPSILLTEPSVGVRKMRRNDEDIIAGQIRSGNRTGARPSESQPLQMLSVPEVDHRNPSALEKPSEVSTTDGAHQSRPPAERPRVEEPPAAGPENNQSATSRWRMAALHLKEEDLVVPDDQHGHETGDAASNTTNRLMFLRNVSMLSSTGGGGASWEGTGRRGSGVDGPTALSRNSSSGTLRRHSLKPPKQTFIEIVSLALTNKKRQSQILNGSASPEHRRSRRLSHTDHLTISATTDDGGSGFFHRHDQESSLDTNSRFDRRSSLPDHSRKTDSLAGLDPITDGEMFLQAADGGTRRASNASPLIQVVSTSGNHSVPFQQHPATFGDHHEFDDEPDFAQSARPVSFRASMRRSSLSPSSQPPRRRPSMATLRAMEYETTLALSEEEDNGFASPDGSGTPHSSLDRGGASLHTFDRRGHMLRVQTLPTREVVPVVDEASNTIMKANMAVVQLTSDSHQQQGSLLLRLITCGCCRRGGQGSSGSSRRKRVLLIVVCCVVALVVVVVCAVLLR